MFYKPYTCVAVLEECFTELTPINTDFLTPLGTGAMRRQHFKITLPHQSRVLQYRGMCPGVSEAPHAPGWVFYTTAHGTEGMAGFLGCCNHTLFHPHCTPLLMEVINQGGTCAAELASGCPKPLPSPPPPPLKTLRLRSLKHNIVIPLIFGTSSFFSPGKFLFSTSYLLGKHHTELYTGYLPAHTDG